MAKKSGIKVIVTQVKHPNPQRHIDFWAEIVVKELLQREEEAGASKEER